MIPAGLPRGTRIVCIHPTGWLRRGQTYTVVRYKGRYVVLADEEGRPLSEDGWTLDRFETTDGADYQRADDVDLTR